MAKHQGTELDEDLSDVDTTNDCMAGVSAGYLVFPLPGLLAGHLRRDKALRLAAWIVSMIDDSEGHADFLRVLRAVDQT